MKNVIDFLLSNFTDFEFSFIVIAIVLILSLVFLFMISSFRSKLLLYQDIIFRITSKCSIVLYVASLCFTGYYDDRGGKDDGILLVIFGALAFMGGGASISWLANPFLWYSWLAKGNPKKSLMANIASVLFILSFLMFDVLSGGGTTSGTDGQVGSCDVKITGYGAGYYLWLLSSVIYLIGNYMRQDHKKNQ